VGLEKLEEGLLQKSSLKKLEKGLFRFLRLEKT